MINMESFFDELAQIKVAAQKCREGSMPIRAANLAKKDSYDGTGKRTTKLAFMPPILKDIIGKGAKVGKAGKPMLSAQQKLVGAGLLGTGALLDHEGKKYMLGRQVYEAQHR